MHAEKAADQLRRALARYRQQQRHGKYPERLQQQACQYTKERRRSGWSVRAIAEELGVPAATAARWAAEEAEPGESRSLSEAQSPMSGMSFVPVMVRPEPKRWPAARLELDFPDGTRVQVFGVDSDALASTIQTLRRQG